MTHDSISQLRPIEYQRVWYLYICFKLISISGHYQKMMANSPEDQPHF